MCTMRIFLLVLTLLCSRVSCFQTPRFKIQKFVGLDKNNSPVREQKQSTRLASASVNEPEANFVPGDNDAAALALAPKWQTWTTRLSTNEDKNWIHKITCLAYMVASTTVLATGATTLFQDIPSWLQPIDLLLQVSVVTMSVHSIYMALKYRKNQPLVRDGFIIMALLNVSTTLLGEMFSPFTPFIVGNKAVADTLVACGAVVGLACSMSGIIDWEAAMEGGTKRKNAPLLILPSNQEQGSNGAFDSTPAGVVAANYFMGGPFTTLLIVISTTILLHPQHDQAWFLAYAENHLGPSVYYYNNVLGVAACSYSALMLTLRDKKLVSPETFSRIVFPLLLMSAVFNPAVYLL